MSQTMDHQTLDRLIERGTKFLRGLSTSPEIYYLLAGAGYTAEEHRRGWELLLPLLGYDPQAGPPAFTGEVAISAPQGDRTRYLQHTG